MTDPAPAQPPTSLRKHWTTRLFLACCAFLLLAGIAVTCRALWNREQLRAGLRRIEARGEPVFLPDAPAPTAEGARTLAWLQRFEVCNGPDYEWSLDSPPGIQRFLSLPESARLSAEDRARLERLALCLAPGSRWSETGDDWIADYVHVPLFDAVPTERWESCVSDYCFTRMLAYPHAVEHLSEGLGMLPLDPPAARGLGRMPQHLPAVLGLMHVATASVGAFAAQRDVAQIVERMLLLLHARTLYDRHSGLLAQQMRSMMVGATLASARIALAQIPAEVSMEPITELLSGIDDPLPALRRAMVEERAIGNEVYDEFSPQIRKEMPLSYRVVSSLTGDDQKYFLDACAEGLTALDDSSPVETTRRIETLKQRLMKRGETIWAMMTPVAFMLTPRFDSNWENVLYQRATLALLRLAFQVRSLEAKAALAAATQTPDPVTGQPMHARIDPEGVLVLWSVGINALDDGAPTEFDLAHGGERDPGDYRMRDDIVVRVRLR